VTLADLNATDSRGFAGALGSVFESSPWVAERAWAKKPFATLDALHEAMTSAVSAASSEEQLALLRAHPDLGTRARMSGTSSREQQTAGLDTLTQEEFEHFTKLNAAYRERFGFPFLYAVKGSTKHAVLRALERRLLSTREAEYQEALRQVYRIARFRLEDAIS
jgi:OHCU decarboxylase